MELQQAITVIIRATQREAFREELRLQQRAHADKEGDPRECISERKCELKNSALYRLDPFADDDGILRVGGRLRRSHLEFREKQPVLIPKGHHLSKLIVRHYHDQVHHQGRQITHGAIRQAGYCLINGRHTISRKLSSNIVCRKLRGLLLEQRMADLPIDRTEATPPFTHVGVDVFGPWLIHTCKT